MKRRIFALFVTILLCFTTTFSLCACNKSPEPISGQGFYFDTIISVTLYGAKNQYAIDTCLKMAEDYEKLLSRTVANSDIATINAHPGESVSLDVQTVTLLQEALNYANKTNGFFDPTIGSVSEAWDTWFLDPNISAPHAYPLSTEDADTIEFLTSKVDYTKIQIKDLNVTLNASKDDRIQIDLGGIAKGFIADQMKAYLESEGINEGFINLGGNVLTLGKKSDGRDYKVGIQKPFDRDGNAILSVSVSNMSVVTSGTYQRCFETNDGHVLHHILDPRTGYPVQNGLASVTVLTPSSTDADALSTACFLMGEKEGLSFIEKEPDTEAIFIREDGSFAFSSGMGSTIPYTMIED